MKSVVVTEQDAYLFNTGRWFRCYDKLGAHPTNEGGREGVRFSVWAPNAKSVSVIGDFNGWRAGVAPLEPIGSSGLWTGFHVAVGKGAFYKYAIESRRDGYRVEKADPFACRGEQPPGTASIVWDRDYAWSDADWMRRRKAAQDRGRPMSIYEMHLGSWRGQGGPGGAPESNMPERKDPSTYRVLAETLPGYLRDMGFTHVELLPVMEHPFYGSWGYQVESYFAPTARYGTPQDLMFLIDRLHGAGIGVLLDWVPSHFPTDGHGLSYFDGTHLFENPDPSRGWQPDWNTFVFDYGRSEVRGFLISSALHWLDAYHVDGLRVDAVASMLYLDYSRKPGQWHANVNGGRENLDAISFLKELNTEIYAEFPDVHTIAEESTAWPLVSRPVSVGGLGFGMKWDMGWMHDTLEYFSKDPIHRKHHHGLLTFRMMYAFSESFILPLSHDEVVYGKRSLLSKMPGDEWQQFANLRAMLGLLMAQPGKKLLFMGAELAERSEWNHDAGLDWSVLQQRLGPNRHEGVQRLVKDLNRLYLEEKALHELDFDPAGFEWLDVGDAEQSVLSFFRKSIGGAETVLAVFNLTPVPRQSYRLGVPGPGQGEWTALLNSDASIYAGTGDFGGEKWHVLPIASHGRAQSIELTLPPLAALFLKGPQLKGRG